MTGIHQMLMAGRAKGPAPAYSAKGTSSESTSTGTPMTPSYPAVSAGDLLIAITVCRGSTSTGPITDDSLTWTSLSSQGSGTTMMTTVWYKIATGSESGTSSFSWSASGSGLEALAVIIKITGNASSGVIDGSAGTNSGSSTTPSPASLTTAGTFELALCVITYRNGNTCTDITGESGGDYAEAFAELKGTLSATSIDVQTATMNAAGTISGGTATLGASTIWHTCAFAVNSP